MVKDQIDIRGYKYASIVRKASRKYDIPEDLIYAIIKTESSFNPYAVSWANAYGLMQVVPKTAGRDVFKLVKTALASPAPSICLTQKTTLIRVRPILHPEKSLFERGSPPHISRIQHDFCL